MTNVHASVNVCLGVIVKLPVGVSDVGQRKLPLTLASVPERIIRPSSVISRIRLPVYRQAPAGPVISIGVPSSVTAILVIAGSVPSKLLARTDHGRFRALAPVIRPPLHLDTVTLVIDPALPPGSVPNPAFEMLLGSAPVSVTAQTIDPLNVIAALVAVIDPAGEMFIALEPSALGAAAASTTPAMSR